MKKLFFVTVILFSITLLTNNLSAQTKESTDKNAVKTESTTQGKFIDKDKNGVCDNHEAKMKTGKCNDFVDKNGDGVCDNQGKNCKGNGKCKSKGSENCKGSGNCKGKGNGCGKGNAYQHRHGCSNR